jgi:SAM-dependent methyltransferase
MTGPRLVIREAVGLDQDSINRRTMASPGAVRQYARSSGLSPAESAGLAAIAAEARGRPILDLGVGAGRTVAPLRAVSEDYLGIDYTPAMIDACRRRYPEARFEVGDARNLASVKSASMFLVVFSCNGLGMVGHADRLAVLREVRRVLVPGGAFLFSTHNLASHDARGKVLFPDEQLAVWHPVRFAARLLRFGRRALVGFVNRRRLSKLAQRGEGYAIINDVSHDYGTMLYYVDLREQRRQLRDAGFTDDLRAWDLAGRPTDDSARDGSIMLLARTPA